VITRQIKTWEEPVRRKSLAVCQGQSTVIGRVLRVGINGNSLSFAAYHRQVDLSVYMAHAPVSVYKF
jgi:hypothetical protein